MAVARISGLIKARRRESNISLREAARQSGMSPSTLSRLERGATPSLPDTENLDRLARWLGMPVNELITPDSEEQPKGRKSSKKLSQKPPEMNMPEFVEVHLRADKNLSPETASALAELFRLAYKQFTHYQPEQDQD